MGYLNVSVYDVLSVWDFSFKFMFNPIRGHSISAMGVGVCVWVSDVWLGEATY